MVSSSSVATFDVAVISGVCLSTMKQLLYGREYDGAGWYSLEGYCDTLTETTDSSEASVRRRLIITGFHDREFGTTVGSTAPPTAAAAADCDERTPRDVGILVVRPSLVASPSQLTLRETGFFQTRGDGARVMLLVTDSQPELGSARTDFVLLQAAGGTRPPEPLPLTVLNLGDTVAAFDALVAAVRLHPAGANVSSAVGRAPQFVDDYAHAQGDEVVRGLLNEAAKLREESCRLQRMLM